MTTTTTPPTPPTRPDGRDRGTYGGMIAVALAAAVLSFSALTGLAELAGITAAVQPDAGGWVLRLAWLLPIAVDAYAVTATRVWLRTAGTDRTRTYARRNAIGAIALSVAGNAAYHALDAAGVVSLADVPFGWAVVVAVSAVPPVLLGLVGHLHALVSEDHRAADTAALSAAPVPTPHEAPPAEDPAPPADPAPPPHPAPLVQPGRTGLNGATRTGTRRSGRTGSRSGTRTPARRPARTDAALTAALLELPREPDGTVPIRRATAALGCGPDRARRLLADAGLLRTTTQTTATTTAPAAAAAAEPAELHPAAPTDDPAAAPVAA